MKHLIYWISLGVIIDTAQLTGAAKYKAYPGKYWYEGKCPLSSGSITLENCMDWCSASADCTAFEHHNHGGACRLKNCAKPPPQPKRINGNYTAYTLHTGYKVPGKMWRGSQCPYSSSGGITLEVCRDLCLAAADCTTFEHLNTGGGCELMNCPVTAPEPTGRDIAWSSYSYIATCIRVTCGMNAVCFDSNGTEPGVCKCKDGYIYSRGLAHIPEEADCSPTCITLTCGLNTLCSDSNGTEPGFCECKDGYIYREGVAHVPEKANCSMTLEVKVHNLETELQSIIVNLTDANSNLDIKMDAMKNSIISNLTIANLKQDLKIDFIISSNSNVTIQNSDIKNEVQFIEDKMTNAKSKQESTLDSIRKHQISVFIIIGLNVLLVVMLIITNIYTYLYFKKQLRHKIKPDDCCEGLLPSETDSHYLQLLKAREENINEN